MLHDFKSDTPLNCSNLKSLVLETLYKLASSVDEQRYWGLQCEVAPPPCQFSPGKESEDPTVGSWGDFASVSTSDHLHLSAHLYTLVNTFGHLQIHSFVYCMQCIPNQWQGSGMKKDWRHIGFNSLNIGVLTDHHWSSFTNWYFHRWWSPTDPNL